MNCLFCDIGAKKIPSDMLYENEHVFAILDIHPKAPGHTMIIPKKHADNILMLSQELLAPVFGAVQKVTEAINNSLHPDGFTIGINHGKASNVQIDHLHIHVIPRFFGDNGGSIHTVVNNPPKEPIQSIGEKIRNSIK